MSSSEDDNRPPVVQKVKRRRAHRACDNCRKKRGASMFILPILQRLMFGCVYIAIVRCDGVLGNSCANCTTHKLECNYAQSEVNVANIEYAKHLEAAIDKMDSILRKFCDEEELVRELGEFHKETWYADSAESPGSSSRQPAANQGADILPPSDDEMCTEHRTLVDSLKFMKINPTHLRYTGKSSGSVLLLKALEAKSDFTGRDEQYDLSGRTKVHARRAEFWTVHPWITSSMQEPSPHRDFPPHDLMSDLISLYFNHINDYFPLLHRPTFEARLEDNLHLHEEGFGSVLLLVCALGARFSTDPRVFLEGTDSMHSRGWKYFHQVTLVPKSLLHNPSLYDLQLCALACLYLQGTSMPQACWLIVGIGIRMAIDVGAHRRKAYGKVSSVDAELWRRVFWLLVYGDRTMCMVMGQAPSIYDEEYVTHVLSRFLTYHNVGGGSIDADYPTECDDEYWEVTESTLKFHQPPGKPSKIAFFNSLLRLSQILSVTLRTIYSINKSKVLLGMTGKDSAQNTVAKLDSELNKWIETVPDHLRWDPKRENQVFLIQSSYLYASYYQVQICVHRPFIPTPGKKETSSFPSLAICTNAARSCIHVLQAPFRRTGASFFHSHFAVFTSALVLLLNIWGAKRTGLKFDVAKEIKEVHTCLEMLKREEDRFYDAGRFRDIIEELVVTGNLSLPEDHHQPVQNHKRPRDPEDTNPSYTGPRWMATPSAEGDALSTSDSRALVRELSAEGPPEGATNDLPTNPPQIYTPYNESSPSDSDRDLPIRTDELSRAPIHAGINNSDPLIAEGWFSGREMSPGTGSTEHIVVEANTIPAAGWIDPVASNTEASAFDQMMYNIAVPMTAAFGANASIEPLTNMHDWSTQFTPSNTVPTREYPSELDGLSAIAEWLNNPPNVEWDEWTRVMNDVSYQVGTHPTSNTDRFYNSHHDV
ncbi:hypothetical protein K474DRAFT_1768943 [Panus rudis PR-1116 ss-1]|nr:hypothetical protein K474DRAFT_1768943 [Panus rudis PR-1116 ss-1]